MKSENSAIKNRYHEIQKNMKALKQANITPAQLANLLKASGIWWKITLNLKEIEGSWTKAIKKYIVLFEGVPRKNIHQGDDHKTEDSSADNF